MKLGDPLVLEAGGRGRDLSCVCGKAAADGRNGKGEDHKSKEKSDAAESPKRHVSPTSNATKLRDMGHASYRVGFSDQEPCRWFLGSLASC
jgi:hypothetical protein